MDGAGCQNGAKCRSVEQCRQALLDVIGDVERQSLDGRGRVHAARGNPDAAIDDKQVFTSWQRPHSFTTERSGSKPMRAVPSRWPGLFSTVPEPDIFFAPAVARISD